MLGPWGCKADREGVPPVPGSNELGTIAIGSQKTSGPRRAKSCRWLIAAFRTFTEGGRSGEPTYPALMAQAALSFECELWCIRLEELSELASKGRH